MRPRRRILLLRFLQRSGVAAAALALTLLLIRLGWGWLAEKRLLAASHQLASQGLQISLKQFDVPATPGEQSANTDVIAAARAFEPMTFRGFQTFNNYSTPGAWEVRPSPQERAEVRNILQANQKTMALLDEAATRPESLWNAAKFQSIQAGDGDAPLDTRLRMLSEFMLNAAFMEHQELHDHEVLQLLQRVLTIDRVLVASPTVAAHELAMSIRSRVAGLNDTLFGDLQIDTPADPRPGGATLAQVKQIAAQLLDDRKFHEQLSAICEYQLYEVEHDGGVPVDSDSGVTFARPGEGEIGSWWLRPLIADERRRELHLGSFWLPIVRANSYETFRLLPDRSRPLRSNLQMVVFSASQRSNYTYLRIIPQHFRALCDGRAAAVLLAARAAEVAQDDPVISAEQLVPAFLPQPAIDPFAVDERPLSFRLDPLGATVWSVGMNGVDEGGAMVVTTRSRVSFEQPDYVYGAAWRAMRLGLYSGVPTGPSGVVTTLPAAQGAAPATRKFLP